MRLLAHYNPNVPPSQRWTWHLKSRNGKTVAASSEGFLTLAKCRKNAELTYDNLFDSMDYDSNDRWGIIFSNESALTSMMKPAKTAKGEK